MNRTLSALSLLLAGCTTAGDWSTPLPPQARYVAMGSSFAAGPGALSRAHDPCAPIPWATGAARTDGVPFHPNLAGLTAIADAIDRTLHTARHRRTS